MRRPLVKKMKLSCSKCGAEFGPRLGQCVNGCEGGIYGAVLLSYFGEDENEAYRMNDEVEYSAGDIKHIKEPLKAGNMQDCIGTDPTKDDSGWVKVEYAMMKSGLKDKNGVEVWNGSTLSTFNKCFDLTGEHKKVEFGRYTDNEEYVHCTHYGWHVEGMPLIDCLDDGSFIVEGEDE